MALNYRSKLFGGGPGGGSGVGTSLTTQVLFNSSGSVAGDAGLTYDAGTDTLTVGLISAGLVDGTIVRGRYGNIGDGVSFLATNAGNTATRWYANVADTGSQKMISGASVLWVPSASDALAGAADSGLRRVSPGLVGVTSGGSNLGSLQAGNVTAVALATPTVTSPLTVNGTPGSTTYGYKAVAFLNDGTSSAASAEVTIATGPATLDGTDNITVAVPAVSNMAYYNLYRTTGGAAPPKLIYSGTTPSYIDTGTEIGAETPATKNTTGKTTAVTSILTDATLGSKSKAITDASATPFATFTIADGATYTGEIIYNIKAVKGTDLQALAGRVRFTATREGSTYTVAVNEVGTQLVSAATGTLTGSISIAGTGGVVTLSANFDTSQSSPDTFVINYRFDSCDSSLAITPL